MRKIEGEDICLWSDGTWCYYEELEEMTHMSDDFEIVEMDSPQWRLLVEEAI